MNVAELVDLVDERGRVRRKGVTRAEVRDHKEDLVRQGLYQPIVVVVVLDSDGRVVVQRRGLAKKDDGAGELDHVCGVVASGETWVQAAFREAQEEIGVSLIGLSHVDDGVNVYSRYRTLAVGRSNTRPVVHLTDEVAEAFSRSLEELEAMRATGTQFVRGFFDDLSAVLGHLGNKQLDASSTSVE